MDSTKSSDNVVCYKYSREELMTMSKLDLSLKKPDTLRNECFNENKRWSPELGFKLRVLEDKHSNGNSSIKLEASKSEPGNPCLRPAAMGAWNKGCKGGVNGTATDPRQKPDYNPVPIDLSPVRLVPNPKPKIIIPPRPLEKYADSRHTDRQPEVSRSWRKESFLDSRPGQDSGRQWNERPRVDRFDNRYDRDTRYPNSRHNGYRDDQRDDDGAWDGGWDDPSDEPFEFEPMPGQKCDDGPGSKQSDSHHSPSPPERPQSSGTRNPVPNIIPRTPSPNMEERMMSELLKIFDDNEVTEIPVVTNPGGSRILGLINQQDQYQSFNDGMSRGGNPNVPASYTNSDHSFRQQQPYPPVSRPSPNPMSYPFGHQSKQQQQQQSDSGGVGNDLLQILQKAKINVNNLPTNNITSVPMSMNVAQAKSLAEIESGLSYQRAAAGAAGVGRISPKYEKSGDNHAFNKLLEMMSSSRTRTESNHLQQQQMLQQQFQQQQRPSSYELERMHEEKKRMEQQQQQQMQQQHEIRRDSLGSSPFVPIQVMRQARIQEQVPSRPLIGRTSSGTGSLSLQSGNIQSIPYGSNFGPRMGPTEAEIRHQMAQFRPQHGGPPTRGPSGPSIGRNSPVNLYQQSQPQFMIPQQMRGPFGPNGPKNQPGPHFVQGSVGLRQPSQLQMPTGAPGPRGGLLPNHLQPKVAGQPPPSSPSQQQAAMNLQQLQMLNQHLHSLPPQQLNEMPRGMTKEQLSQMLFRASQ